ncbi:hypothetical protein AQUCO_01900192v1 [Aquilegia coerulea]|uniref:Uncharacterized protein n=1 Tax=Aquilegia coerulea TaxID=218851 RepID=A0A2G5DJC5_AQUCA|nr:hypothetical protein AQUCO_01900192v1 [Aquilegia coerulea]
MFNDQFSYIKSNNEAARVEREAKKAAQAFEKAAQEAQGACSLSECINVLHNLKEFGELPKGAYKKAMVKFVDNPNSRKNFYANGGDGAQNPICCGINKLLMLVTIPVVEL